MTTKVFKQILMVCQCQSVILVFVFDCCMPLLLPWVTLMPQSHCAESTAE